MSGHTVTNRTEIVFPHYVRRDSVTTEALRMLGTTINGVKPSVREVATLLGINRVSLHRAVRLEAARKARREEGWHCLCCGRPIISGPIDKEFCSVGCRANHRRNEAALEARLYRLCVAWGAKDLDDLCSKAVK